MEHEKLITGLQALKHELEQMEPLLQNFGKDKVKVKEEDLRVVDLIEAAIQKIKEPKK